MRTCNKCGESKPLVQFYKTRRKKDKDPEARHHECKECAKKRVKARHESNPDMQRNAHYKRTYGVSLDEVNEMLSQQNGKCACCGSTDPKGKHTTFCVDHCHETDKVRAMLCNDCNIVLGIIKDSPEHLERMIDYLKRHHDYTDDGRKA